MRWLEGQLNARSLEHQLSARELQLFEAKEDTWVEMFDLALPHLTPASRVKAPDTLAEFAGLYAVTIQRGFRGPNGDPILRQGDRVFLSPVSAPRHFDLCVVRKLGVEGVKLQYILDRAEVPSGDGQLGELFCWSDEEGVRFDKMIAHFPR